MSLSTLSKPHLAASLANLLLSLGHTAKAREWMNNTQFKGLPKIVTAAARAGWFQGSVFMLIAALQNYRWAQTNPGALANPLDRAMAALTVLIYWASAAWYLKNGDNATGGVLVGAGGVQSFSAFLSKP